MSEANLETARRWLNWPGGAPPDARIPELWEEECDYYPVRRLAGYAPCHGLDELQGFFAEFWDAWQIWQVTLVELTAVDDTRVLAQTHVRGVGKGSGIDIDGAVYHAFWLRHGRILRLEDHLSERAARRALGL